MIVKRKFRVPGNPNAKFLSMDEYLTIAKKEITYYCKRYKPGYLGRLLQDDEAISTVAYANMLADWRYIPNEESSQKTFRMSYAINTIKGIILRLSQNKHKTESLDGLVDVLISRVDSPDMAIIKEEEDVALSQKHLSKLSARAAEIVRRHFIENESQSSISADMGVSRQRINQIIERSLCQLREEGV